MPEKIIFFLTALLGFITIFLLGFRYKTNRNNNFYLIVFFFLSSFRFLTKGLSNLPLFFQNQKQIDLFLILNAGPLMYFYFSNLINNHKTIKKNEILHFIVPLLLFILFCFREDKTNEVSVILKIGTIVTIGLVLFYTTASFKLLRNKVWKRNSDVLVINQQNKIIKRWTQLLFGLFSLMLLRFLINLAFNNSRSWYLYQNNFLWVGALIWIVMYIKILHSPEFLYGYDVFQNKIREYKRHNIVFDNIWIMDKAKEGTNVQDSVLKEKIIYNIENYVLAIEDLAINTNLFFSHSLKKEDIAQKLNIPKSHLDYIFKYHAKISFADFKKIIRVQKIILLIDKGYLQANTMESLATETGFSSYSPFFKSFKSITGMSPQEYIKKQ